MVDLPTVPDRIVTSTAPTSSISRGDIQGNADLMAGAIAKVADAQMDIATRQAKDQAANDLQNQKVTRDADGNVSVANPANSIIFGRAGEQYQAAVQAGTVAQHGNVISQTLNDMHQQYETDPAGFKAAADSFKASYMQQHGGGIVGEAISRDFDQTFTQHYNSITDYSGKIDVKNQDSSLSALQTRAHDDAVTLLRGGAAMDDPAVQGAIAKFDATTQTRSTNPLFGYSQEQAQLDRDTFHGEAAASRFLYKNDQIYKDQGPGGGKDAALKDAQDLLTNPDYHLSPQQRQQFYHQAVGEIRANEAIRKQDIGEARAAFSELSLQSAAGARISSDQVEQVAGAFRAAGDPGSAARVYSSFIRKPLNDDFGRQPLATQTQQLTALQGAGVVNKSIPIEGRQLLDFIAKGESGGRYDVRYGGRGDKTFQGFADHPRISEPITSGPDVGKTSSAAGRYQFIGSTWDQQARKLGLKDFSPANQDAAAWDLAQTEYKTKTGRDLLTTLQSGDMTAISDVPRQLAGQWSSLPGGRQPASGRGVMPFGPAGSAWLAANRANEVDDAATKQWKTVMADYTKDQTRPSLQTVNDVVNAARATRNSALLDTIAHDADRMDLSGEFSHLSLPDQHARLAAMEAAGQRGELQPGGAATMKDLQQRSAAITKGLDDNPIATTASNFPDKIKPQPPLDFSSDQNLAAGLQSRGKVAQFAAQNWQTPPLSALDSADVAQVQSMLASPDPAVKGRVFNALSALPEEVRNATLAKIGGGKPDTMVSVAAGSMMKGAPDIGASIIRGQQAMKTNKEFLPSGTGESAAFTQEFDKRVPASTFSLAARTDASGPYAVSQGMVKARYADLSAQSGDTSGKLNTDRLQQSVDDVTGGILDHNGGKLIAPVRGMPQSVFDRTMAGITDNDLPGVSTLNGQPVTADYLRNNATLESVGDGRYYVKLGKDPLRPVYAYQGANTEAPQKFMLDLRNRPVGNTSVAYAAPVLQ